MSKAEGVFVNMRGIVVRPLERGGKCEVSSCFVVVDSECFFRSSLLNQN